MSEPRFQRRKDDRPAEITEAAMQAFAENGYAATRVEEVAKRAGVSKGLLYLYFKTKEEPVQGRNSQLRFAEGGRDDRPESKRWTCQRRNFCGARFSSSRDRSLKSPARKLVRLLVSEGPKHPDLTAWYFENVVSRGMAAIRMVFERGVRNGEFRESALDEFPQLLVSPVIMSMIWAGLFEKQAPLDTDRLMESHVDLVLAAVRKTPS